MNRGDRWANLALFAFAAAAWIGVAVIFQTLFPQQSAATLLAGALLLGGAVTATVTPLFWLGRFVMTRRIAYRGDWWRALRRGALVGLVVTLFVVMRGMGAFSMPLLLFVVAMAVLVELTLSVRS
ncbi:MAG TPA: hypothetical protein VMZ33_03780 [Candidatus Limnocylindrales bacterium]|nr:hypothetical protein [Candidatus Limnocylindrales bacterium]